MTSGNPGRLSRRGRPHRATSPCCPSRSIPAAGDLGGGRSSPVCLRSLPCRRLPRRRSSLSRRSFSRRSWNSSESRDPKIGEGGRRLLARQLGKLSDKQIRDLFVGARFDVSAKRGYKIVDKDGKSRRVTINDWVPAFKDLRREVSETRSPR